MSFHSYSYQDVLTPSGRDMHATPLPRISWRGPCTERCFNGRCTRLARITSAFQLSILDLHFVCFCLHFVLHSFKFERDARPPLLAKFRCCMMSRLKRGCGTSFQQPHKIRHTFVYVQLYPQVQITSLLTLVGLSVRSPVCRLTTLPALWGKLPP